MYSLQMDEIDYQSLIYILSQKPYYPLSMHLRNHLLAAYSAQHNSPDSSIQDPWTTYRDYRKGVQMIAAGDVPAALQKKPHSIGLNTEPGLWGIAILFPTKTSSNLEGSQDQGEQETGHIWHTMRLLLWLSSETNITENVSIDNVKVATSQEETLLLHLLHDFLPQAIQRHCQECSISSEGNDKYPVDLFAVNDAWVKVMRRLTEEGDARILLNRANPCMTFIKSEGDALVDLEIPPRWHVDAIKSREEMEVVQCANSLRFPLWYIEQRKHISILMRDGKDADQIDNEYPTTISQGSPAAWAYAHDDLSLASLHVAEPYRRSGLGKACVFLMGKKLIHAQKRALIQAGCASLDLLTPFLLDTEMHKGASRLFFEAQGFTGIVVATWGTIIVCTA